MPSKPSSSSLSQYGFQIKKGPRRPRTAKSAGLSIISAPAQMVQPKAKPVKNSTICKVQSSNKGRRKPPGGDLALLKPKEASKVTKPKAPAKSTKLKAQSWLKTLSPKPTRVAAAGNAAGKSKRAFTNIEASHASSSQTSKIAPLLAVSNASVENPTVTALLAPPPDATPRMTEWPNKTLQRYPIDVLDTTSGVKTEVVGTFSSAPDTTGKHADNTEFATFQLLEPRSGNGDQAGRLAPDISAVSTFATDTTFDQETTLPTRHRTPATTSRDQSKAPAQCTPAYIRQLRDAADPSPIQTHSIPASGLDSEQARTIAFKPINARLISSTTGFDEYTIATSCRIPSGSASKTEVLQAFEEHLKADSCLLGSSRFSEKVVSVADDSSEEEPLMNQFATRRALARGRTGVKIVRNVVAGDQVVARVNRRAATNPSINALNRDRISGEDNSNDDDQSFEPYLAAGKHTTSAAARTTPRDAQPSHTVLHTQNRKRLNATPHPSAKPPSRHDRSAHGSRTHCPTPPHRGPSFRQLTPTRAKTPLRHNTPARLRRDTPVPPTIRRRRNWARTEANLSSYITRRHRLSRHRIFADPKDRNVARDRMEFFWGLMADLITEGEAFAASKGWEDMMHVLPKINARVCGGTSFGVEEGGAILRELMRQRMLIVAGGKVMLTRNALSTRLS